MSNHAIQASQDAEYMVQQPAKWILSKAGARNLFTASHYVLTVLGIAALTILGAMFINPDFADRVISHSPFTAGEQAEAGEAFPTAQVREAVKPVLPPPLTSLMNPMTMTTAATVATAPVLAAPAPQMATTTRQQKLVTNWLAKRYRVAGDAAGMLVSAAYETATETKLDPLLLLAVMAIESSFNPFAESPVGAQGLMQVMSKVHHDKFEELGGVKAALNPVANIKVGAIILKEYVTRGGSVEAGLKSYVGAAGYESDGGYGAKVMSEYNRLKEVAYGKQVPYFTAAAKPVSKPATVAAATTTTASATPAGIANVEHVKQAPVEQMVSL